jgi:hypothetical protein
MFAAFHHSVRVEAMPAREVIRPRSLRRLLAVCALVIGLLGLLVLAVRFGGGGGGGGGGGCPGPSSGQVVTTAATWHPGCMAAWSRVGPR